MPGKKLLWFVLALGILSSGGCCRFWDRVCHDHPQCGSPPQCAPPPMCPCQPTGSFSSPPGVTPVPNAPTRTTWQGNCQ